MRPAFFPSLPLALLVVAAAPAASPALAQNAPTESATPAGAQQAPPPVYKPPLRGAPGGRVGGASRSAVRVKTPLPVIELLAPADHAGITASPTPTLYFFVSRPVAWPTEFTISAPMQPAPVLEVKIPSPSAAGLYPLRLADYPVRLQPGVSYTWSVSVVLDPRAWSRNIVASATIIHDPSIAVGAAAGAQPPSRTAQLAGAGLWYDAVAAAIDSETLDRHAAIDALIEQAGLTQASLYEKAAAR